MLTELPAVAIEGAKGVGKTVTTSRRARAILTLSLVDPVLWPKLNKTVFRGFLGWI
ncbi:hypothetical protein [Actinomyces slackii]|uniref:hypothetical protein n=1 Tax=Actinomyces slackii TaxID=52774 RepID=UPI0012EB41E8|nr:hypothetical protein [Actinomyces slackii]